MNNLHGIEYSGTLVPELAKHGIDVVMVRKYEPNAEDIPATLADAMTEADRLDADAFIGLSYPDATFPMPGVAMEMGYNPKFLELNVGASFTAFDAAYGEAAEGVVGAGAWNGKQSEAAAEYEQKLSDRTDGNIDYWGQIFYYASCQFMLQAIEQVGEIDQAKLRDVIATSTFDTAAGPMKFENGINLNHPGEVGQWQNGVFEVIAPADKATSTLIYPRPDWPAPPAE